VDIHDTSKRDSHMGQMTFGVLFGCHMEAPESLGEEGWYTHISAYKPGRGARPDTPHGDGPRGYLGVWVAVGASGEEGAADLDEPFPLDFITETKAYREPYQRAVKAWDRFAEWSNKRGIVLPAPRLYLVPTEVA